MPRAVVGDIGGTNTRLHLIDVTVENGRYTNFTTIGYKKYKSGAFCNLIEPLNLFLKEKICAGPAPVAGCFAVAGPVQNGYAKLTNVAWELSEEKISEASGIPNVTLINDFAGVGFGLAALQPKDVIHLNPEVKPVAGAPMACLGAGTGLGQVYAVKVNGSEYQAFSSEGGHVDFAPRNQMEFDLLQFIKKEMGVDRVSVENVVSGSALPRIYKFFSQRYPELIKDKAFDRKCSSKGGGVFITQHGVNAKDKLCEMTFRKFGELYGAEAGNLAVKMLSFGGLFVAGGVVHNAVPVLSDNKYFLDHALAKGQMKHLVSQIPFYLVMHDNVGLLGAKVVAARLVAASDPSTIRARL